MIGINPRSRGLLALVIIAAAYAMFGPINRELAASLATYQQVYLRVVLALAFLMPFAYRGIFAGGTWTFPLREWGVLLVRAFAGYTIGVGFFVEAVTITKVANVAFIAALPLASVWGVILFREKVTRSLIAGLLISTVGLGLVGLQDVTNPLSWGLGELYGLISAIGFSFALVARKFHRNAIDNLTLTIFFLLAGLLITFITSVAVGEPLSVPINGTLALLLLAGAFLVAIVTLLQNFALVHVPATVSGAILATEGFFALVFAWLIFHELPRAPQLIGGALIVIGAVAILRSQGGPSKA